MRKIPKIIPKKEDDIDNKSESKNDRFKRLASKRTNEIIYKIRILGNCSNKSTYKYSKDDVNKIFKSIEQELREVKSKFTINKKEEFKL